MSKIRAVRSQTRTSPPKAFSRLRNCLKFKISSKKKMKHMLNSYLSYISNCMGNMMSGVDYKTMEKAGKMHNYFDF